MVKSSTKAAKANVWINDELFFDEELLEDIAKKLMRSYNVKVEVADSLRNKRFMEASVFRAIRLIRFWM